MSHYPFDIIAHTDEILIIQTHAGEYLQDSADKQSNHAGGNLKTGNSLNGENNTTTYGQFNLGLHVKDSAKSVLNNRSRLLQGINHFLSQFTPSTGTTALNELIAPKERRDSPLITPKVNSIYWVNQIHSNIVYRVSEKNNDRQRSKALETKTACNGNALEPIKLKRSQQQGKRLMHAPSADALITDRTETALAIMTADCVPIVIYDRAGGQIATVHAGWQGLANGIIANVCREMSRKINCDGNTDCETLVPFQAWIGTCITQSCYEVSRDVVAKVLLGCQNIGLEVTHIERQIVAGHSNPEKAWLDLPALAKLQLEANGVHVHTYSQDDRIAFACSYSDSRYYSYRRMTHSGHKHTGRMAMIAIRLK